MNAAYVQPAMEEVADLQYNVMINKFMSVIELRKALATKEFYSFLILKMAASERVTSCWRLIVVARRTLVPENILMLLQVFIWLRAEDQTLLKVY